MNKSSLTIIDGDTKDKYKPSLLTIIDVDDDTPAPVYPPARKSEPTTPLEMARERAKEAREYAESVVRSATAPTVNPATPVTAPANTTGVSLPAIQPPETQSEKRPWYVPPAPTYPSVVNSLAPKAFDEAEFQNWYKERADRLGLVPDPDDPEHHYDYRAAYMAGAEPGPDKHWPSQFKMPDHPDRYIDGIDTITGKPVRNNNVLPEPSTAQPSSTAVAQRLPQKEFLATIGTMPDWISDDQKVEGHGNTIGISQKEPGFMDKIKYRYRRGEESQRLDQQSFLAATGFVPYEQVKKQQDDFAEYNKWRKAEGKNWLSETFYKTVEMMPPMAQGIGEGMAYGIGAALLAGTSTGGIGAVPAYATAQTFGSMAYWWRQGSGMMYSEMRRKGISHEVAAPVALSSGLVYAALEYSQVDKIIPGIKKEIMGEVPKVIGNSITQHALRFGNNIAVESLEESNQQFTQIVAEDLSAWLQNKVSDAKIPRHTSAEVVKEVTQAFYQSLGPFALLTAPSAALNYIGVPPGGPPDQPGDTTTANSTAIEESNKVPYPDATATAVTGDAGLEDKFDAEIKATLPETMGGIDAPSAEATKQGLSVQPTTEDINEEKPKQHREIKSPVFGKGPNKDRILIDPDSITPAMAFVRDAGNFRSETEFFNNVYLGGYDSRTGNYKHNFIGAEPFAINPFQSEIVQLKRDLKQAKSKKEKFNIQYKIDRLNTKVQNTDNRDKAVDRYNEYVETSGDSMLQKVGSWDELYDLAKQDFNSIIYGESSVNSDLEEQRERNQGYTDAELAEMERQYNESLTESGHAEEDIGRIERDAESDFKEEISELAGEEEITEEELRAAEAEWDAIVSGSDSASEPSPTEQDLADFTDFASTEGTGLKYQDVAVAAVDNRKVLDSLSPEQLWEMVNELADRDIDYESLMDRETFDSLYQDVVSRFGKQEQPTPIRAPFKADLTTSLVDTKDARTGEPISTGEEVYYLPDTKETIKVSTYQKMTERPSEGELFAPGTIKETPVSKLENPRTKPLQKVPKDIMGSPLPTQEDRQASMMGDLVNQSDMFSGQNSDVKPSDAATELRQIADDVINRGSKQQRRVLVQRLSPKVQKLIKDKTGIELNSDYTHIVNEDAIRHSYYGHNDKKTEEARGQIPLSIEDFEKIPDVLSNPDDIIPAGKYRGGSAYKYKKRFNGSIIYVEVVREGEKHLALQTMWKEKAIKNPAGQDAPRRSESPQANVQDDAGSSKNISQNPDSVKSPKETASFKLSPDVLMKLSEKHGLDRRQMSFIVNKITSLGSVEAVNKKYSSDSGIDKFARETAAEMYGDKPTTDTTISPNKAYEYRENREIPDGWYVHGRAKGKGVDDLDTGNVLQLTRNWDVAEQYGGEGSQWMVKPKEDAYVLDLSDPDSTDMGKVVDAAINANKQNEKSWVRASMAYDIANSIGKNVDEIDVDDITNAIKDNFAPEDIVDTAGAYDNEDWLEWLNDKFEPDFIKTPNGAVVINTASVEKVRVPESISKPSKSKATPSLSQGEIVDPERRSEAERAKQPWEMTREEYNRTHPSISLTSEDVDVDQIKKEAGIKNIIMRKNGTGHTHIVPTFTGGKNSTNKWTSGQEEAIRIALHKQGYSVTKEFVDSKFNGINKGVGEGFRIYGDKSNRIHLESVKNAITEGKPVPSEVLADYPYLVDTEQKPRTQRVGTNINGLGLFKDEKGNRYYTTREGINVHAKVSVTPTRSGVVSGIKSLQQLYDNGDYEFLTKEEFQNFESGKEAPSKPEGKVNGETNKTSIDDLTPEIIASINAVKPDGWRDTIQRERIVQKAIFDVVKDEEKTNRIFELYKSLSDEEIGNLNKKTSDTTSKSPKAGDNVSDDDLSSLIDETEETPSNSESKASNEQPSSEERYNAQAVTGLLDWVREKIKSKKPFLNAELFRKSDEAFGGTQAEGKYTPKDAHDAMELAVNFYIANDSAFTLNPASNSERNATEAVQALKHLLSILPTQGAKRTEEMTTHQQFSTPPPLAYVVNWAANIGANDVVLEPSAGTGGLVAFAKNASPKKIYANEISQRRADLLRLVGVDEVFTEDAEQLDNILPDRVKPTVIVMNPPFSATAGRTKSNQTKHGARHIEQALARLEPGGRLVAIVGRGMGPHEAAFRDWWKKIKKDYSVKANIGISGQEYKKYGTTFDNQILVIDKTDEINYNTIEGSVQKIEDLIPLLKGIRDARPEILRGSAEAEQSAGKSSGSEVFEGTGGRTRSDKTSRSATSQVERGRKRSDVSSGTGTGKTGRHTRTSGTGATERVPKNVPAGRGTEGERDAEGVSDGTHGRDSVTDHLKNAADEAHASKDEALKGIKKIGNLFKSERGSFGHNEVDEAVYQEVYGHFKSSLEHAIAAGKELKEWLKEVIQWGVEAGVTKEQLKPYLMKFYQEYTAQKSAEETVKSPLEIVENKNKSASKISDSIFDAYSPKYKVKGSKPHPTPLVESAAMADTEPPVLHYHPHLPQSTIESGKLSDIQIEAVAYTGQAHKELLPSGERKGFFIGDGTGVGKGREIAGIIYDNWNQGRKKAVWISEKWGLMKDAARDLEGIGWKQGAKSLISGKQTKLGEKMNPGDGVLFMTYDTLRGTGKKSFNEIRLDEPGSLKNLNVKINQIVDWLGKDFDGVIAFDEAHNMGNAIEQKGKRGKKKASGKALAGVLLQQLLPKARVVYISATGATEVYNLSYATRLGLWGEGTAFSTQQNFIDSIDAAGLMAMEYVARDMKAMGVYTSRSLAYVDPETGEGVEYERLEHELSDQQREIYDELAGAWQIVLQDINKALDLTEGRKNSAAISAFWGAQQRFFNQVITSMSMPSVIAKIKKDIADGYAVVVQLTTTGEAQQERAIAALDEDQDIEELDTTPRDTLMEFLRNSFPVDQYEEYVDENNNTRTRPVLDSNGNPVTNKQAEGMRDALLEKLGSIRIPASPLDYLLDELGYENVAEVTGRSRRVVYDTKEGKKIIQRRSASAREYEANEFMDDKRQCLVFSQAGSTGRSFHSDRAAKNQRKRIHYLLQAGWRADIALQGLGRTHRSNQMYFPIDVLVTVPAIKAQARFISTIARRLDQLGALTRGQRETGSQGIFKARDNLESDYAQDALRRFIEDVAENHIDEISSSDFEQQTGLRLKNKQGHIVVPSIQQFLNRMLSLKLDMQNKVFDEFSNRLDSIIQYHAQNGDLDVGIEMITGEKINKVSEQVVHTDKKTGAKTKFVEVDITRKAGHLPFDEANEYFAGENKFYLNTSSNRIWVASGIFTKTDSKGDVTQYRSLKGVPSNSAQKVDLLDFEEGNCHWKVLTSTQAKPYWDNEYENLPKTFAERYNIITGALLPIFDRLKGASRIYRLQTNEGERILGRIIHESDLHETLNNLGVGKSKITMYGAEIADKVLNHNAKIRLSNGWTFKKSKVSGDDRIEIIGAGYYDTDILKKYGVFTEQVNWQTRYFVPVGETSATIIDNIIRNKEIASVSTGYSGPDLEHEKHRGGKGMALHDKKSWNIENELEPTTKETVNKTDIIRRAEKLFDIPIKGKATHKWRAAVGMYYPEQQIVRMKKWGEIAVMAHEIAHHLDAKITKFLGNPNWKKQINPKGKRKILQTELADLDYDQKQRRTSEGFAEFMRYYLTTDKAKSKAPNFFTAFTESFLPQNPDIDEKLNDLKGLIDTWEKQGAENRILAQIDMKGEHTKVTGIKHNIKRLRAWVQRHFNDEFYDVQNVEKEIERITGKKLRPSQSPSSLLEYGKSKAGAIARTFVMDKAIDETGKPVGKGLEEILKPVDPNEMPQFIAYASAKRALVLESRGKESGFDVEDADYIAAKYAGKGWDSVIDDITAWSNHLLDWVVRAGGLGKEEAAVIRELNPVYLPFKRAFVDELGVHKGAGRSFVNRGQTVKRLKGSGRPIINPIESLIAQATEMISKAQKIRIASTLAKIAEQEGIGGFITKVPPPMSAQNISLSNIKDFEGILQELGLLEEGEYTDLDLDKMATVFFQGWQYMGKDNIVSIWRNGQREFYEIHPDLYRCLSGMDAISSRNVLFILASKFSRMLRLGATGIKVSFGLVTNPFRDTYFASIASKNKGSLPFANTIRGTYKEFSAKEGDLAWRFKKTGGALSGMIGFDRAATMRTYDDMLFDMMKAKGKTLYIAKHPIQALGKLVDITREAISFTELAPRIDELTKSHERLQKEHPEWTEEDCYIAAFNEAQDLTVNFTKSGHAAKYINEVAAFFNVAIRGPEKAYRLMKERPVLTIARGIGYLTTIALLLYWKNKDKDWFKNLPPAYKYANLFIELSDRNVVRLPLPFEFGIVFASLPMATLDAMKEKDPKYAKEFMRLLSRQIPDPTPSAIGPVWDVATNKNYLGTPIESEGMQYQPVTERKRYYTSKLASVLSKGFNALNIKLSPIQIDYLLDSYTGGFRRQLPGKTINEPADIPVLGDIMLRMPDNPKRQLNSYFADYERLGQKDKMNTLTLEEKRKFSRLKRYYPNINHSFKRLKKLNSVEGKKDMESIRKTYQILESTLEKSGYK